MTETNTIIGELAKATSNLATLYPIKITSIAMTSILFNIIIVIARLKSRRRYIDWKDRTINFLGVWKESWERNNDEVLNQLFDDNIRLEKENKLLKKQYNNQSMWLIIGLFVLLIFGFLNNAWNKTKDTFTRNSTDK